MAVRFHGCPAIKNTYRSALREEMIRHQTIAKSRAIKALHLLLAGALITLLSTPAAAQITVAGDLIEIQAGVRPGDSYGGKLTLRNVGSSEAVARVYVNDVLFEGQEQSYLEPGRAPRSNGGWLQLDTTSVQLAAGESTTVAYSVTVPVAADLSGSYWSMVMVENSPGDTTSTDQGVGIRSLTRYGVYVVTNMLEDANVELDFVEPRLHTDDGGVTVVVSVRNSGLRLVRPKGYLDLYNSGGGHAGRIDSEPALIFPNEQVGRSYRLGHLEPGDYTAIVVVDAGGEDVFGARYTLSLD